MNLYVILPSLDQFNINTLLAFQFHAEYEFWREDRFGRAEPLRYSVGFQLACFLGVMFGSFGIYWFLNDKRMYRPTLPKQLPGDGKPHYTFEAK